MKSLSYGQMLALQHHYWQYLASEECDCTEDKHIECHKQMFVRLAQIDEWNFTPINRATLERIRDRMVAFSQFTQDTDSKHVAQAVIARIDFRRNQSLAPPAVKRHIEHSPPVLAIVGTGAV